MQQQQQNAKENFQYNDGGGGGGNSSLREKCKKLHNKEHFKITTKLFRSKIELVNSVTKKVCMFTTKKEVKYQQ